MKAKPFATFLSLSSVLLGNCLAFPTVSENFDGDHLDTVRWYPYNYHRGQMVQANGVLNYTDLSNPTAYDFSTIELLTTYPGYFESWQMFIDLAYVSKAGDQAACGFMICNKDDRNDYLFVGFSGKAGIAAGVYKNGIAVAGARFSSKVLVSEGSIRVRFDATTKLLTFFASPPGIPKHWVKIGSFSPTGHGAKVNADWQMAEDTGAFGIQLWGFGRSKQVKLGDATLDNFKLSRRK